MHDDVGCFCDDVAPQVLMLVLKCCVSAVVFWGGGALRVGVVCGLASALSSFVLG